MGRRNCGSETKITGHSINNVSFQTAPKPVNFIKKITH